MKFKHEILQGFYCLEGLDGSGTTTQLEKIAHRWKSMDIPHFKTNEPTDSTIGKIVRNVLSGNYPVERETLARLFAADRGEHIFGKDGIKAALSKGEKVICDRYLFSSLAYQSVDIGFDKVWELNRFFPLPEIVFYLEISPDLCLERIMSRGQNLDIYETRLYQQKISEQYESTWKFFENTPCKMIKIDASVSISSVYDQISKILFPYEI